MCELSAADGFVEINENLGDMIKCVANEPSVGLYYIQQHAQNAVPNIIRLKNNVSEKSHEVNLHTEDLEDSIAMTRTMKQCGSPIIDEMIQDIKTSLTLMSTKQPVRGVIQHRSSSYQISATGSWAPVSWARSAVSNPANDGEKASSYFSSVFKSAKEKASSLKWPQSTSNASSEENGTDELPVSIQVEDKAVKGVNLSSEGNFQPEEIEFDEFQADKESRLEEWLEGSGTIRQNESDETIVR